MIVRRRYYLSLLILAFLAPLLSYGQDTIKIKDYVAERVIGKPPVINGKLNDEAWTHQKWGGHFFQYQPYNGAKPSQKTVFKVLYDNNNIYVGIRCWDNHPDKIVKRLSRRDQIDGDWIGIAFDSYNDNLTAFAFAVSAAGVKFDGKFTNDNNMDATWNPVWYVKTSIDGKGWVAEMRIPLSQLRFSRKKNMSWGFQVIRNIFRKQEEDTWQFVPKGVSGWVSRFGILSGLKGIKPKKEIALMPYVMGKLKTEPPVAGDPFATGKTWGGSAGLNGKVALTNYLTLNYAINPDFGQVEADPAQVNLSAFEIYYQERRPFFVAGKSLFTFPISAGGWQGRNNLFYSRRIGRSPQYYPSLGSGEYAKLPEATRILGAVKLSGKTSTGWSIGILESVTAREFAKIDSAGTRFKEAVEPLSNYFNTRIQKDFNNGNTTVGGMVTATNRVIKSPQLLFLPNAAYTGGLDFNHFWKNRSYKFSAKMIASSISGSTEAITDLQKAPQRYYQRPDSYKKVDTALHILQGTGLSFQLARVGGGHWTYGINANMVSPGLSLNDQGYLRIADIIQQSSWVSYSIWEPFSIFNSMNYSISQWSGYAFSGRRTFSGANLYTEFRFKNFMGFNMGIRRSGYELDRHELRGGPSFLKPGGWGYSAGIFSNQSKNLVVGIHYNQRWGDQSERAGKSVGIQISYQPFPFIKLVFSPGLNQSFSSSQYVGTYSFHNQTDYVLASIHQTSLSASLRINLSFSPDMSLEYWGRPYLFAAKYSGFKKLEHPDQRNFASQFHVFSPNQIHYDAVANEYVVDDTGDGSADFYISNPNFNVMDFQSNMVFRWEFVPGSTLYLVWSQNRSGYTSEGYFQPGPDLTGLANLQSTNIFLLKLSYRISM